MKKHFCVMCDQWVAKATCDDCDTKTLPRNPWTDEDAPPAARSVCACGGGWTFDFAAKRVYCKTCEAQNLG